MSQIDDMIDEYEVAASVSQTDFSHLGVDDFASVEFDSDGAPHGMVMGVPVAINQPAPAPQIEAPVVDQPENEPSLIEAMAERGREQATASLNIGAGVLDGINTAAMELLETTRLSKVADWLDSKIPLSIDYEKPTSVEGTLGSGVGQVGAGMFPAARVTKALGAVSKFLRWTVAGALTDFAFFDPDDPGLGDLARDLGEVDNETLEQMRLLIADSFAKNEDDAELEKRLKTVGEGVVAGATIDSLILLYRGARGLKNGGADRLTQVLIDAGVDVGEGLQKAVRGVDQALDRGVEMMGGGDTLGMGVGPVPKDPVSVPKTTVSLPEQSRMVSARFPTGARRSEDPVASQLNIGYEAVSADPKVLQRNTDILRIYPGARADASADPVEFAGQFVNDAKENLIWLHNRVPEQTRQRSKLWYAGANKISQEFSARFNVPDTSVAGVMAALSPQKDWFVNVSLAERTLDILTNQRSFQFSDDMARRMEEVFSGDKYKTLREAMSGKSLDDLAEPETKAFFVRLYDETYNDRSHRVIMPEGDFGDVVMTDKGQPSGTGWGSLVEISKAVRAYESNGDRALMTDILGSKHKVRSFYNNIIEPNSANGDVTIDTHAVAAALLRPLSGASREVHHNFGSTPLKAKQPEGWQASANSSLTGVQGTYGLYAEAYRQAAEELGILPRELQSITWEAVRGMFTGRFKTAKNVQAIDDIWRSYSNGDLSIDEVRQAVEQAAGGINAPAWQ